MAPQVRGCGDRPLFGAVETNHIGLITFRAHAECPWPDLGLPIVYNQWIRNAGVGDFYKDHVVIARRLARLKLSPAHRIAFIRLALHWRRLARA